MGARSQKRAAGAGENQIKTGAKGNRPNRPQASLEIREKRNQEPCRRGSLKRQLYPATSSLGIHATVLRVPAKLAKAEDEAGAEKGGKDEKRRKMGEKLQGRKRAGGACF